MRRTRNLVLTGLILATFAIRVLPYAFKALGWNIDLEILNGPWNFSPLMAVCLLGGMYFENRKLALAVPLAAWFLSSIAMSLLTHDWLYLKDPGLYLGCGCYMLASLLGTLLEQQSLKAKLLGGVGLVIASECLYFVITNTACWLYFPYVAPEYQYPWTVAGLMSCYEAGLPFFKHSLMSSALFFPVLWVAYELARRTMPVAGQEPQAVEV